MLRTGQIAYVDKKILREEDEIVRQISSITKKKNSKKSIVVEFNLEDCF